MRIYVIILLTALNSFAQNSELKPYIDFLETTEKKSAKEYILNLFQDHDIVILCERDHSDFSQYELIKDIISDQYFKKNVKNIFTEIGAINLQPEITEFLKQRLADSIYLEKKLNSFQQNACLYPVWERYNYHYLLRTIYEINDSSEYQISYYPSDAEFDWSVVYNIDDYEKEYELEIEPRDSLIAFNIITKYEEIKSSDNSKALIILNFRHAFKLHSISQNGEISFNAGKYLYDYFGDQVVSILSNRPVFYRENNDWSYKLIQDGKWDAAFNYLKIDNIGFDLMNSPFGNDIFDLQKQVNDWQYKDVFDGFIFYKNVEEHDLIDYYDGLVSKDFEKEFFRRLEIYSEYLGISNLSENLKDEIFRKGLLEEYNTKRHRNYRNLDFLIESRNKHLNK